MRQEVRRILREAFDATTAIGALKTGIDNERWRKAATSWIIQRHPSVAQEIQFTAFEAAMMRELNDYIRASRKADVQGARDIDKIVVLQRRVAREIVVFVGENGKPVRKRLADVQMDELPKVIEYYRRQEKAMARRAARYQAIYEQMRMAGLGSADLVSRLVA